ncbi:unnamed protein product, partial [Mesorhabditis belari]|uniref:Uncharacterized protein n=1 Tax=Mesorhabditis belari TaxID=2138241 RepID=A0AAF3FN35_9BILA
MKHISSILLFLFVFTLVECCSGRKIDSNEVVSLEQENEIKTRKSGEKKEMKENKESTGIPSTESPKWKEVNAVRHVYEDALNLMAELRTLVMDNEINEEERHWEVSDRANLEIFMPTVL